jgi:hypothetical protein
MLALRAASCEDQLRGHAGKKRRYWLVLKEIMRSTLRATILSAYVGMALVSSISARKNRAAKLVVLLSDCKRKRQCSSRVEGPFTS